MIGTLLRPLFGQFLYGVLRSSEHRGGQGYPSGCPGLSVTMQYGGYRSGEEVGMPGRTLIIIIAVVVVVILAIVLQQVL
jgi:hypothetical protein